MNLKNLPKRLYQMYLSKHWNLSWYASGALMYDFLFDYAARKLPLKEVLRIHAKGFSVYDWCYCGITHETSHKYLSNVDYSRPHPYNGEYSKWIDDKLTLKHICAGTPVDQYMPEYYYHIDETGKVLRLMDCHLGTGMASAVEVSLLLEEKRTLAIKRLKGAVGNGFYKAEYAHGDYFLNGEKMTQEIFCSKVNTLRNYLVTEYFFPHVEFARYCTTTPGCIRYAACRVDGALKLLASFVRFGTSKSGFVENYGSSGEMCLVCSVDDNGYYRHGSQLDPVTYERCLLDRHPDTGVTLTGRIPHWEEICRAVKIFGEQFPQLVYLGFDFVVTSDDRVKILEINSLSSIDCLQEERSVFDSPAGAFFLKYRDK